MRRLQSVDFPDSGAKAMPEGAEALSEFVRLITRHQPDLWAFILSQIPGHPDAADILQEANVTLWTNRQRFTPGTDFIAWAFTVARFAILKHLKKDKRVGRLVFREELLDLISSEAPEAFRDGNKRLRWLETCLSKLRPTERELIEFRYHEAGSLEDYGRRIGRTPASLSVSLHRVRAALRACIERELAREECTT